jgi:hypothetical protein
MCEFAWCVCMFEGKVSTIYTYAEFVFIEKDFFVIMRLGNIIFIRFILYT